MVAKLPFSNYYQRLMDSMDRLRKYEPDKIALLVFFAAGLLIAYFMVAARYTGPARAGREIIEQMKEKGISSFLGGRGNRSFFLIKTETGRAIGFRMSIQEDSNDFSEFQISSTSYAYIAGLSGYELATKFQCDERVDEFSWTSDTIEATGRSRTRVVGKEDGTVSISSSAIRGERIYRSETIVMPFYLLGPILKEMRQSNHSKIIVDVIESDGTMTPASIRKVRRRTAKGNQQYITEALKVDLLDGRQHSHTVYFDDDGEVLGMLLKKEYILIFDRSSSEEIMRLFPKRANLIVQTQ